MLYDKITALFVCIAGKTNSDHREIKNLSAVSAVAAA